MKQYTPDNAAWQADTLREMNSWFYGSTGKLSPKAVHRGHSEIESREHHACQAFAWHRLTIDALQRGDIAEAADCAMQFGMFSECAFNLQGRSIAMQKARDVRRVRQSDRVAGRNARITDAAKSLMKQRRIDRGKSYTRRELAKAIVQSSKSELLSVESIRKMLANAEIPRNG